MSLIDAFQKFAGREVPDNVAPHRTLSIESYKTLQEIYNTAIQRCVEVRLIYPGQMVTADYNDYRVNVHIAHRADKTAFVERFSVG